MRDHEYAHHVYHDSLTGGWRALGVAAGIAVLAASYRYWASTIDPRERREAHRDALRAARRRAAEAAPE